MRHLIRGRKASASAKKKGNLPASGLILNAIRMKCYDVRVCGGTRVLLEKKRLHIRVYNQSVNVCLWKRSCFGAYTSLYLFQHVIYPADGNLL